MGCGWTGRRRSRTSRSAAAPRAGYKILQALPLVSASAALICSNQPVGWSNCRTDSRRPTAIRIKGNVLQEIWRNAFGTRLDRGNGRIPEDRDDLPDS